MKKVIFTFLLLGIILFGCKKKDEQDVKEPQLIFKLKFDPDQERLDSRGEVITELPDGHAAQSPSFNIMSAHYIELTPSEWTFPGEGERVYEGETIASKGTVTIAGNELNPIDFSKAITKAEGEIFYQLPIKDVQAGTYPYIRVSVTYQNFDIKYNASGLNDLTGTLASFVGYGQYIGDLKIKDQSINVDATKTQGFWAVEDNLSGLTFSGQAPAGATTVVNPLAATSAIAEGSCLVTGVFDEALVISGNETNDVEVELSFSINQSFEWKDLNSNGQYDSETEQVVDMGLRGLKPNVR